jgi:hypothetical protein
MISGEENTDHGPQGFQYFLFAFLRRRYHGYAFDPNPLHDNLLPRECVSTSRSLAMAVFSDSIILAFITMSHCCDLLCTIVLVLCAIHLM